MDEKSLKRKEWIKNAIIIFLVIMLILTFFSNTIMNLSIPEVTTAYVQSGSITEMVRGTGNVNAADPYKVLSTDNRKIASVLYTNGDVVEYGEPIILLEESESDEIKKLKEEIEEAELNYNLSLLDGSMSVDSINKVNNGNIGSFNSYLAKIKELDDSIATTKAAINVANEKVTNNKNSQSAATDTQARLEKELANEKAKNIALYEANVTSYQKIQNTISSIVEGLETMGATGVGVDTTIKISELMDFFTEKYEEKKGAGSTAEFINASNAVNNGIIECKNSSLKKLTLDQVAAAKSNAEAMVNVVGLDSNYSNIVNGINSAMGTADSLDAVIRGDEAAIAQAKLLLEQLEEQKSQLITNIKGSLTASSSKKKIDSMKEQLAKLEENAYEGKITAPIGGTIMNLNLVAGEAVTKDQEIFTIIPEGKGLVLQVSLENDQAKRVKKGDMAELPWRYEESSCIVTGISPDPDSGGKRQIVTFAINDNQGLFMIGQSITVSIGSGANNYDMIVPKAAVRSDNSGEYVYVIKTRNSPLGNRYMAEKVKVTKLASDDNYIAIQGELNPYDYVVVQSSKILGEGGQVKLSQGEGN